MSEILPCTSVHCHSLMGQKLSNVMKMSLGFIDCGCNFCQYNIWILLASLCATAYRTGSSKNGVSLSIHVSYSLSVSFESA